MKILITTNAAPEIGRLRYELGSRHISGFVLGTYASQDYDLSEAEKYCTKLAYDITATKLR